MLMIVRDGEGKDYVINVTMVTSTMSTLPNSFF